MCAKDQEGKRGKERNRKQLSFVPSGRKERIYSRTDLFTSAQVGGGRGEERQGLNDADAVAVAGGGGGYGGSGEI